MWRQNFQGWMFFRNLGEWSQNCLHGWDPWRLNNKFSDNIYFSYCQQIPLLFLSKTKTNNELITSTFCVAWYSSFLCAIFLHFYPKTIKSTDQWGTPLYWMIWSFITINMAANFESTLHTPSWCCKYLLQHKSLGWNHSKQWKNNYSAQL